MRIAFFTDTYHPSTNGIIVVIDIMRQNLEQLGHEVYVVAPAENLKWWQHNEHNVIRYAGVKGLFFSESMQSLFFPPRERRRLAKYNFDVVIFFTPAQIGMMGAYFAISEGIPLVSQHSTDLVQYVDKYPMAMPAVLAVLASTLPLVVRANARDTLRLVRFLASRPQDGKSWNAHTIEKMLTFLYDACQLVISVSPKVTHQLVHWGTKTPIETIPTGVDLGVADARRIRQIRKKYKLSDDHVVLLSLGRVAEEKNLDLMLDAIAELKPDNPQLRALLVGDFDYRPVLELRCRELGINDIVHFTGKVSFAERWCYFAVADIFCFPSLTDTQALVVNEAGLMSLPIVWCDDGVNEVLIDGKTGIKAKNTPSSYAKALHKLVHNKTLRLQYGRAAKKRATKFTEIHQTQKLVDIMQHLVARRP